MKEITQQIYDDAMALCRRYSSDVYDELPGEVPYPFVYVGDIFDQPLDTKDLMTVTGTTQLSVHVYGESRKRRTTTDLISQLRQAFTLMRSDVYETTGRPKMTLMQENPNKTQTLLHGVLTVEFSYARNERKER